MPAGAEEVARAREEGIEDYAVLGSFQGDQREWKGKGHGTQKCVSVRDASGRFNPQYDENEKTVVNAENILMAVGQQVDLDFLDGQLQLTQRGAD